jgi:hypothetical protein
MSRPEFTFPRRQPSVRFHSSAYCILNTIRIGRCSLPHLETEIPLSSIATAEAEISPDA